VNLNQVTVPSTDVPRAIAFYRRLGLRLIVEDLEAGYARFECPGGATFSVHADGRHAAGAGPVVYFECEELDDTVARLRAAGVAFDAPPRDQPWLWREAHLRDPDGNLLCLYRAGANRRFPPWRLTAEEAAGGGDGTAPTALHAGDGSAPTAPHAGDALAYTLGVESAPAAADVQVLRDGLSEHALSATRTAGFHDVAVFARAADGTIVGGAMALLNWTWLYLALLWVAPELRGTGLGHALLARIERVGVDAGCTDVHLDTFSYQARPFYERHGYEVFAALERYPDDHRRYFMRKRLARADG
jgi:GNAT superfamily N-acetyltransferase/predicted enzyme related to lactoylglutathione lyase